MITAETDTRVMFLSALARALARFGEDSDTIERDLVGCAARLGLPGQFYATPTMVMASFGSDEQPRTILLRIHEGRIDLEALDRVNDVRKGVMSGEKTAPQALAELNLIAAAPARFPWVVRVLASGLGAGSFAIFLGGDWPAFIAAVPVGLVVGAVVLIAQRYARLHLLAALLGAFAAAVTTLAVGHVIRHFSLPTVALAGLILLLPGLAITTGVAELAARQLSSGTARLAGATVTLVNLGVGSFLGFAVVTRLDWVPRTFAIASHPSTVAVLVAVVATAVSLHVSANARTRDWPLTLGAVVVALAGRALRRLALRGDARRGGRVVRAGPLRERLRAAEPAPGRAGADPRAGRPGARGARPARRQRVPAHGGRRRQRARRRRHHRRRPRGRLARGRCPPAGASRGQGRRHVGRGSGGVVRRPPPSLLRARRLPSRASRP